MSACFQAEPQGPWAFCLFIKSEWDTIWVAPHFKTISVRHLSAIFDLFDQTTTELWQTFLFQIIHLKTHVTIILAESANYILCKIPAMFYLLLVFTSNCHVLSHVCCHGTICWSYNFQKRNSSGQQFAPESFEIYFKNLPRNSKQIYSVRL